MMRKNLTVRAGLFAFLAWLACNAGGNGKVISVVERNTMPELTFKMTDDAFWSGIFSTLETVEDEAQEKDFHGIHLEGPRVVDIHQRATLPLVGLRRATLEEAFYLRLDSRAVITGISKADNSVRAEMAWINKSAAREDFTPPKNGFQRGTSIDPFTIEVRDRLEGLPWAPGEQTFILYLFDQQSNPVTVQLRSDDSKASPSERMAESKSKLSVFPVPDAVAGHSFVKDADSPAMPEKEGISLRIMLESPGSSLEKCIAHGAFRLKALAGEFIEPTGVPVIGMGPGMTAVVPISLLVLGENLAGPYLFPIRCPAKPVAEKGVVEGYFSVNLLQMPKPFGIPQKYAVRALHGRARSEPIKFSLK